MKNKEITVCKHCNHPVVFTLAFDGAEYYCLRCGKQTGILSNIYVESTPALRAEYTILKSVWRSLRSSIVGSGRYQKTKCKKCVNNELHGTHLTVLEIEKDRAVMAILSLLKNNPHD